MLQYKYRGSHEKLWREIKIIEKRKNMTQEKLAEVLDVSRHSIALWEKDKSMPNGNNLQTLCRYFQVNAEYFFDAAPDQYEDHITDKVAVAEATEINLTLKEAESADFVSHQERSCWKRFCFWMILIFSGIGTAACGIIAVICGIINFPIDQNAAQVIHTSGGIGFIFIVFCILTVIFFTIFCPMMIFLFRTKNQSKKGRGD